VTSGSGIMVHGSGGAWVKLKETWERDFRANCDSDDIPILVKATLAIVTNSCKKKYFLPAVR
jgi:hypothetical protein